MICAVNNPQRVQRFQAALQRQDLPGLQLAVHQQVFGQLPGSGWQFYTSSREEAPLALAVSGVTAQCCGSCDLWELSSFLRFLGVEQLAWRGECPPGFRAAEPLCQLRMSLEDVRKPEEVPAGCTLQKEPSMFSVTELVAQEPALAAQGQEFRDAFYARSCTLRNHGRAEIWALAEPDGSLAATAGLYAIHQKQAFLSGVHTRQDCRKGGLGGWLVQALAAHMAEKEIETVLWCRPQLEPFYRELGFRAEDPMPQFVVDCAHNPAKTNTNSNIDE